MRRALMLFGPVLVAGLVLTALAMGDRDSDPLFELEQRRLRALSAQALEKAVQDAPEPRPDNRGKPALSVRCEPGAANTELRNPWTCRARYPERTVTYTVRVRRNGEWRGISRDGVRQVYGRLALPNSG